MRLFLRKSRVGCGRSVSTRSENAVAERTAGPHIRLRSHGKPGQAGQALHFAPSKNISRKGPRNCRSLGCARDDKGEDDASLESGCWTEGVFHLLRWAAGLSPTRDDKGNVMRLSLGKGAHADLSNAAWQEIRVRSGRDDHSYLRRAAGAQESVDPERPQATSGEAVERACRASRMRSTKESPTQAPKREGTEADWRLRLPVSERV